MAEGEVNINCPSLKKLVDYLCRDLPRKEMIETRRHVLHCTDCFKLIAATRAALIGKRVTKNNENN